MKDIHNVCSISFILVVTYFIQSSFLKNVGDIPGGAEFGGLAVVNYLLYRNENSKTILTPIERWVSALQVS